MIRKLHKCAITDCNFYWHQIPFDAQFCFWKNGAYGAYLPLSIAQEMIDVQFDNLLEIDQSLFVSTKEIKKFINNITIKKIDNYLKGICPVMQKFYHVKKGK